MPHQSFLQGNLAKCSTQKEVCKFTKINSEKIFLIFNFYLEIIIYLQPENSKREEVKILC